EEAHGRRLLALRLRTQPGNARHVPALPPRAGPLEAAPRPGGALRAGDAGKLRDLAMAEPLGAKKHSLLDHMMGVDGTHAHAEGDYDHDHDHDDIGEYDVENDALWQQDHIQLVSVGIDI